MGYRHAGIRSDIKGTKQDSQTAAQKDPCWFESRQSMKCLEDNGYDRTQCQKQFDNYQACKKFWGKVYSARKWSGITPYDAPPEEREGIKQIYLKTGKIAATPDG